MNIQKTTVTAPPTLHVFLHACEDQESIVKKARQLAKRSGGTIQWWNGNKEWYEYDEIVNLHASGSDQYTWDRAGCKVLHSCTRITVAKDGTRTIENLKPVYRVMES